MIIKRVAYAVCYIVVLIYNIILSAISVAVLCISGKIDPTIMEIDTVLKKEVSQTLLANSITLTPGTLTIDIDHPNQKLKVAVITKRTPQRVIPFEKYIKGMLE